MDAALEAAEQKLDRAYGSAPLCDEVCEELLGTDKDKWFMAHDRDELKAFYERKLPAIRESARKLGYALGVHGSMLRDLDLIAAPWNGEAADKDALAHAIAIAACGITRDGPYQWTRKSESRFAVSIPVCWTAREETNAGHIDLSVFVYPWSSITESDYVSLVAALRAGVNVNYEAADAIVQLQTERDALAALLREAKMYIPTRRNAYPDEQQLMDRIDAALAGDKP